MRINWLFLVWLCSCQYVFASTIDIISTIAGDGSSGYNNDDIAATAASLWYPYGVAVDSSGRHTYLLHIYSLLYCSLTTYRITYHHSFYIYTGNVYIADTFNNRIRFVSASTGNISTIAGKSYSGYNGDGINATSASLWNPYSIAVDSSGRRTYFYFFILPICLRCNATYIIVVLTYHFSRQVTCTSRIRTTIVFVSCQ